MIEWLIMADIQGNAEKIDENGTRWMVKFEKKHSFKSAPLNLFNQHINSEILHILGFSAQKTFLGLCDDYLVLCCKNFVPEGSKLITFDVFLRQSYNSYELTEFTDLDQFEHVLNEHELLHLYKDKLTKSFWDMVVLECFSNESRKNLPPITAILSTKTWSLQHLFSITERMDKLAQFLCEKTENLYFVTTFCTQTNSKIFMMLLFVSFQF